MANKFGGIRLMVFLIAGMFVFMSNNFNPPDRKTGAPGEGLCFDCHSVPNSNIMGTVNLAGVPEEINPGEIYRLSLTSEVLTSNSTKAGFQMTILDQNEAAAGVMSNPSAGSVVTAAQGREYFEHAPAGTFVNDKITWEVDWMAPDLEDGTEIIFYAVNLLANSNGATSGDNVLILKDTMTIKRTSNVINEALAADISIAPNPAIDYFSIDTELDIKQVSIYDINGGLVKSFQNENNFDVRDIASGMYFVRSVFNDEIVKTKKLYISK